MDVSCAADAAYVPHTAAMLHSVLTAPGSSDVHVHYLVDGRFPSEARTRLEGFVEGLGGRISFREIPDAWVAGLRTLDFITAPMWFRIFLPRLLPEVDRILYLDADTLATDSLTPLWDLDLSNHHLAAVTNVFLPDHVRERSARGLEVSRAYFNSGVLLFNLDLMRRDGSAQRLRDYAIGEGERLMWPDQDTLNAVLGERRLALPPRWNTMNSVMWFPWAAQTLGEEAVREARRHPAIRHFEGPGPNKPWHYLADRASQDLYRRHRSETPWPRYREEGRTAGARVRRRTIDLGWSPNPCYPRR